MSFSTNGRASTLVFRIRNVSKLLPFREFLRKERAFVAMVAAFLKFDHPEVIYTGYNSNYKINDDELTKENDSAIIRVSIPDKNLIFPDVIQTISLVIKELEFKRNVVNIDSRYTSPDVALVDVTLHSKSAFLRAISRK